VAERIRFHLDESVNVRVARALRRYGCNVTTTSEAGVRTQPDSVQHTYAHDEGRVIVTRDADFLRFASRDRNHAGIVYWSQTSRSLGEVIENLILLYEIFTAEEMNGRVEYF
jgi:predicted nuclease of predicted toxin-antitoxin system